MKVKREHVEKFKKLYEKTFNEEITSEEASKQCLKLVLLLSSIYEPMTLEELKRVKTLMTKTE
jgi:hypothetical protein